MGTEVTKDFFIMLYNQKGDRAMPITDEDDNVVFFESLEAAKEAMKNNPYAEAFGFEIFELGTGEIG